MQARSNQLVKENNMKGRPTTPENRSKWTTRFLVTNINKCIRTDFGGNPKIDTVAKKLCEDDGLQKFGVGLMPKEVLNDLADIIRRNARYHIEASRARCKACMIELLLRLNTGRPGDMIELSDTKLIETFHKLIRMQYPHQIASQNSLRAWIDHNTTTEAKQAGVNKYLRGELETHNRLARLLTTKAEPCLAAIVNFTIQFTEEQLRGSRKRICNSLEEAALRLKNKPSQIKVGFSLAEV